MPYAASKLCDVLLAFAVARRWKDVKSNALEPGWVATKMGGPSAPDDLHQGCVTQAWLATSDAALARSGGGYFHPSAASCGEPDRQRRQGSGGVAGQVRPDLPHRSRLTRPARTSDRKRKRDFRGSEGDIVGRHQV